MSIQCIAPVICSAFVVRGIRASELVSRRFRRIRMQWARVNCSVCYLEMITVAEARHGLRNWYSHLHQGQAPAVIQILERKMANGILQLKFLCIDDLGDFRFD